MGKRMEGDEKVDIKAMAADLIAKQQEWDRLAPDSDTAYDLAVVAIGIIQTLIKSGNGEALKAALVEANAPNDLVEAITEVIANEVAP
jgi:hypothetical protein